MKTSQYLCATQKEVPHEGVAVSHQLMIKAGLVRPIGSGIYAWLPTGQRVLQKLTQVVQANMRRIGGLEMTLPTLQPSQLWETSRRLTNYGAELFQLNDRRHSALVLGATHEEVITSLLQPLIQSAKQLPLLLFQVSQKFRDEKRPRFGVLRGREFMMKDAYSFHTTQDCLEATYARVQQLYHQIFEQIGLDVLMVKADSGSIGGNYSHEFHALASSGEDRLLISERGDYAANLEIAYAAPPDMTHRTEPAELRLLVAKARPGESFQWVFILLQSADDINLTRLNQVPYIDDSTLSFSKMDHANAEWAKCWMDGLPLPGPLLRDNHAAHSESFNLNIGDLRLEGLHWHALKAEVTTLDLRQARAGDLAPNGLSHLRQATGIEVGHLFQLQTRYSECFQLNYADTESGARKPVLMGCYGLGISRIIAAFIEQHHDKKGIRWSRALAPFQLALVILPSRDGHRMMDYVSQLYHQLLAEGIEVLWEDRPGQTGFLLSEVELMGIPYVFVFSKRSFETDSAELRTRIAGQDDQKTQIPLSGLQAFIQQTFACAN